MFVGNILSLVWVSEAHRDMRAKPFSSFYFASGSLEVKLEEVKGRRIEESGKLYSQSHQVRPRGMSRVLAGCRKIGACCSGFVWEQMKIRNMVNFKKKMKHVYMYRRRGRRRRRPRQRRQRRYQNQKSHPDESLST